VVRLFLSLILGLIDISRLNDPSKKGEKQPYKTWFEGPKYRIYWFALQSAGQYSYLGPRTTTQVLTSPPAGSL
jgi:hypothetical protein